MDGQFKFAIDVFAYQMSRKYMTSTQGQIVLIDRYWDKLLDSIDLDELAEFFNNCCEAANIPSNDYDLNQALLHARNEWRVEMMTTAANNIAFDFADYDVPYGSTLVKWNDNLRVMEFLDNSLFF